MRSGRALHLRIGAAVGIGLMAAFARAGHYRWTTSGPEAGLVSQVVVNPQNSDRLGVVAGYYGQFVFWSSDRGHTWAQDPTLVYAQRLVPDPTNGSVLYAFGSTANATGVFKTIDGGLSWSPAGNGLPRGILSEGMSLAPSAPNVLYLVVGSPTAQVYRSDDGAGSWSLTSGTFMTDYVGDVEVDPSDPAIAYVVGYPGIFKTIDSGASWTPSGSFVDALRLAIDPTNPATLYVATGDAGVWKSIDGGAHWSPSNTGIETAYVRDIAIDPAHPQRLWIAATAGGAMVSENAGQSWAPVDLGPGAPFATAIAEDPRDPSLVYAAAGLSTLRGGLLASADGGVTWASRSQGLSGFLSDGVTAHPAVGGTAVSVSDADVLKTEDGGATWSIVGTADDFLFLLLGDPTDADTLYAGYSPAPGSNGVLKSVDGGATWNPASSGFTSSLLHRLAISASAPDHILAGSVDGLFGTQDGGGNWSPLFAGDVHAAAIDPSDSGILYAGLFRSASPADGLLRSSDGGINWNPPAGLPTTYPKVQDIAIPLSDPSRVYAGLSAGGGNQGIYRSLDRGLSFVPVTTGLMAGFTPSRFAIDPSSSQTIYVFGGLLPAAAPAPGAPTIGAGPSLFWTRSGGDTWTALPGFLPAWSISDLQVSADGRTIYAATVSGVFQFSRSFTDVPDADPFWTAVDAAAMNGVTVGCGSGRFCPANPTSRASVAALLLRGKNGGLFVPPPATGTVFADVPAGSLAADFIEELAREGITSGCGGGDFCPSASVTRAEMAVLVLKTLHGAAFVPPPATGTVFADVPMDAFAAS
jgi:photosystem II stability/assembly factor-like uncharacterized protein